MTAGRGGRGRRRRRAPSGSQLLIIGVASAGCIFLAGTLILKPRPLLVWNVSASAPPGLYRLYPGILPAVGGRAASTLPRRMRKLAAERKYLPPNVPLVKWVAAAGGDRVCARHSAVFVNSRLAAVRKKVDPRGRVLPGWSGCVTLRHNEYFLLGDNPWSFDGRYFGVTPASDIIGRAEFLWPG